MRSEASAILVCAYDSKEQCQKNHLESAIDLEQFASQADAIPQDQEVVFYCARPNEAAAAGQAEAYEEKGFTNTKALAGGAAT